MFEVTSSLDSIGVIAALAVIGCLIFAECAFLIGLFVPGGDLLLLASGVFAAEGSLPLAGVLLVVFIAAATGYEVGYYIGKKTGPQVFKQQDGVFFRKEYADRAAGFYKSHGGKTILIARFVAYVRTIAPLLAGIGEMRRTKFVLYNILGAVIWSVSLVMIGFWFGSGLTEEIKQYTLPVTLIGLAGVCIVPLIVQLIKVGRARGLLKKKATFDKESK